MADIEQQQQVQAQEPANETPEQKYARLYQAPAPTGQQQTPPATQLPQEFIDTMNSIRSELAEVKNRVNQPPQQQTPPQQGKHKWVERIQAADFDGAEQALQERVLAGLGPKFEEVRQQAYHDALSAAQVNVEVDRYLQGVRSSNPDILPFERYLQGPIAERMQLAQQAGRVRNPSDFLREYKAAVDSEVVNLRTQVQTVRASGKDEATSRLTDVSRSMALNPQAVQSISQNQDDAQLSAQGESTDDYFTRRAAEAARRRGM